MNNNPMMDSFQELLKICEYRSLQQMFDNTILEYGWSDAWNQLKQAFVSIWGERWFSLNKSILTLFESEELAGYDGDVIDIVDKLPCCTGFSEARANFQSEIYKLVREQLSNGGSTLFYDINSIGIKPSGILHSNLVKARKREFSEVVKRIYLVRNDDKNQSEELREIWKTGYGFNILKALRVANPNDYANFDSFSEVVKVALDKTVAELLNPEDLESNPDVIHQQSNITSERLSNAISTIIRVFENPKAVDTDEYYWLYETGLLSATNVLENLLERMVGDHLVWFQDAVIDCLGHVKDDDVLLKLYLSATNYLAMQENPVHVELLIRVLLTELEIYDSEDIVHGLHETILESFVNIEDNRIGKAAVEITCNCDTYIDPEDGTQGMKYVGGYLIGTSWYAFELTLQFIMKYECTEAIHCLWSLEDLFRGGSPTHFAKAILTLEGEESIPRLIEHILWYHPYLDYEWGIDHSVVKTLADDANAGTAALVEWLSSPPFEEAAIRLIETLEKIGQNGIRIIAKYVYKHPDNLWDAERKLVFQILLNANYHKIVDLFLILLYGIESYESARSWVEEVNYEIDYELIIEYLSNQEERLRIGALIYIYLFPEEKAVKPIKQMLSTDLWESERDLVLRTAISLESPELIQPILDYFISQIIESAPSSCIDLEYSFLPIGKNFFRRLDGKDIRKLLLERDQDWKIKAVVILILSTFTRQTEDKEFLIQSGLNEFVINILSRVSFFEKDLKQMGAHTPEEFWRLRSITLAHHLDFIIIDGKWDTIKIVKAIEKTDNPLHILEFISDNQELLSDLRIKEAIRQNLPKGLENLCFEDLPYLSMIVFHRTRWILEEVNLSSYIANAISTSKKDVCYITRFIQGILELYSEEVVLDALIKKTISTKSVESVLCMVELMPKLNTHSEFQRILQTAIKECTKPWYIIRKICEVDSLREISLIQEELNIKISHELEITLDWDLFKLFVQLKRLIPDAFDDDSIKMAIIKHIENSKNLVKDLIQISEIPEYLEDENISLILDKYSSNLTNQIAEHPRPISQIELVTKVPKLRSNPTIHYIIAYNLDQSKYSWDIIAELVKSDEIMLSDVIKRQVDKKFESLTPSEIDRYRNYILPIITTTNCIQSNVHIRKKVVQAIKDSKGPLWLVAEITKFPSLMADNHIIDAIMSRADEFAQLILDKGVDTWALSQIAEVIHLMQDSRIQTSVVSVLKNVQNMKSIRRYTLEEYLRLVSSIPYLMQNAKIREFLELYQNW